MQELSILVNNTPIEVNHGNFLESTINFILDSLRKRRDTKIIKDIRSEAEAQLYQDNLGIIAFESIRRKRGEEFVPHRLYNIGLLHHYLKKHPEARELWQTRLEAYKFTFNFNLQETQIMYSLYTNQFQIQPKYTLSLPHTSSAKAIPQIQ
ncbi:MAG: hypothetical protein V1663_05620 [archaeon]